MELSNKVGLIAGNGRFPFLVLDAARSQGIAMVVAAIKEETFPEIEEKAHIVHWMSLGQLGKLIKTFKAEGVNRAVMAGQVKHKQIFSGIVPDLKMIQLLAGLATKSTDSLIGGVARVLENEGIELMDSTAFLGPLLPDPGVLTARAPSKIERRNLGLWFSRCPGVGSARSGSVRRRVRWRVCGPGGHGGHGCRHSTRRVAGQGAGLGRGEIGEAQPGPALRRACCGAGHADNHGGIEGHSPGH